MITEIKNIIKTYITENRRTTLLELKDELKEGVRLYFLDLLVAVS